MSIRILADATLPNLSELFIPPFALTRYQNQSQIPDLITNQDVLLCRSTLQVDAKLLANSSIQCVATASSGTDHIDSEYLRQHNISLFDARGSNATAVADYVVATLAALNQSGKSIGKLAGVIGVGEVGSRVVARLHAAGFNVICFDPLKAQHDTNYKYVTMTDLLECDLLCVHANLHESAPFPSKNLLDATFLAQLKSGVKIINASRGGIIDEEALLTMTKPITYCADVFSGEPAIDPRIVDFSTICTPHIAGHSIEAKYGAVLKISQQLHQFYGLTPSSISLPQSNDLPVSSVKQNWQEFIIDLYNPLIETQILKAANNKQNAFLTQRKAHQYRHDFNCYAVRGMEPKIKLLCGN